MLRIAADARQRGAIDGPAIENFVLQCGHRGLNELDPTAPVWETQRSDLEAMIWRMATDDLEDPVETGRGREDRCAQESFVLSPAVRREHGRGRRCVRAGSVCSASKPRVTSLATSTSYDES